MASLGPKSVVSWEKGHEQHVVWYRRGNECLRFEDTSEAIVRHNLRYELVRDDLPIHKNPESLVVSLSLFQLRIRTVGLIQSGTLEHGAARGATISVLNTCMCRL